MKDAMTIGADIAKNTFFVVGLDAKGKRVLRTVRKDGKEDHPGRAVFFSSSFRASGARPGIQKPCPHMPPWLMLVWIPDSPLRGLPG